MRTGAAATLAASLLAACASTAPAPLATPTAKVDSQTVEAADRVERTSTTQVTATVKEIDQATRRVVLLLPEGREVELVVGDQVRNLSQVAAGDQVRATYQESLAFRVRKAGEAELGTTGEASVERALPGETPGSHTTQMVTVTTTVKWIDREKQTITLGLADGRNLTLAVQNPANLDKVQVGELLEVTYREALAISVEKP